MQEPDIPGTRAEGGRHGCPGRRALVPPEHALAACPVWTAVVPVAAAVAGLLFATSAQTAKGTDLRVDRAHRPAWT